MFNYKLIEGNVSNNQYIFKDTNDPTVDDSMLIEQIECAINADDQELSHKKIKETKDEIDEFTILHFAAKNCRPSLFKYLIDMFNFGASTSFLRILKILQYK